MVNLPLKRTFSPPTDSVSSIVNIMNDMRKQQNQLTLLIGGLNTLDDNFSDDLLTVTNSIDGIVGQTNDIESRLLKQQNALISLQSSANKNSGAIMSTLTSEITQLRTVTSKITTQANTLKTTISNGINSGTPLTALNKNIGTVVNNFSSNADNLISGLTDHSNALASVISKSQTTISGIITNPDVSKSLGSVQDMIGGSGVNSLAEHLTSFNSGSIDTITRESDQKFTEISDVLKGTLDDIKNSVGGAIASKVGDINGLKAITNNIEGAVESATNGFANLANPMAQLSDISSKVNGLTDGITANLGSMASGATDTFTQQLGQINEITSKMESLGSSITSQANELTSTLTDSINNVGGLDPVTGFTGGLSSLTNVVDPANLLASSMTEMNNLSHSLTLTASSLDQFATGLPANNPITQLTTQLKSVGQSVYNQTALTPDALLELANVTASPNINVGAIEKTIESAGADLTSQVTPSLSLNINVDKMTEDLTKQILAISNNPNSFV